MIKLGEITLNVNDLLYLIVGLVSFISCCVSIIYSTTQKMKSKKIEEHWEMLDYVLNSIVRAEETYTTQENKGQLKLDMVLKDCQLYSKMHDLKFDEKYCIKRINMLIDFTKKVNSSKFKHIKGMPENIVYKEVKRL